MQQRCDCVRVRLANGLVCLASFAPRPTPKDWAKAYLRSNNYISTECTSHARSRRAETEGAEVTEDGLTCLACIIASYKDHREHGQY